MKTKLIGKLNFDSEKLNADLKTISSFEFSDVYQEFICGEFRSCMLMNKRGEINDTILETYDGEAKETIYLTKLPYLKQLIANTFNSKMIKFTRLLALAPNSVFMPHRDYLELKESYIRIHIPIKTDKNCFHAEESKVYHMDTGEIWFLDASKVHSAASFSTQNRLHIVIDFAYTKNLAELFNSSAKEDILKHVLSMKEIKRPSLPLDKYISIISLAELIENNNFYNILSILIKLYFKYNLSAETVFDWLHMISELSNQQEVIHKANFLKKYCLLDR